MRKVEPKTLRHRTETRHKQPVGASSSSEVLWQAGAGTLCEAMRLRAPQLAHDRSLGSRAAAASRGKDDQGQGDPRSTNTWYAVDTEE